MRTRFTVHLLATAARDAHGTPWRRSKTIAGSVVVHASRQGMLGRDEPKRTESAGASDASVDQTKLQLRCRAGTSDIEVFRQIFVQGTSRRP